MSSVLLRCRYRQSHRGGAQTPQTSDTHDGQKVVVGSAEVLIDALARDKLGRAVTDLSADDFEVYEDRIRHQVNSFRLIKRGAAGNSTAAARPAGSAGAAKNEGAAPAKSKTAGMDDSARLSAVAIVFDRAPARKHPAW